LAVGICDAGSSLVGAVEPVDGSPLFGVRAGDVPAFDGALDLCPDTGGIVAAPEAVLEAALEAVLALEAALEAALEGFSPAPAGDRTDCVPGVLGCEVMLGCGVLGCRVLGSPVAPMPLERTISDAGTFVVMVTTPASLPLPQPVSSTAAIAVSASARRMPGSLGRAVTADLPPPRRAITDPGPS